MNDIAYKLLQSDNEDLEKRIKNLEQLIKVYRKQIKELEAQLKKPTR